MESDEKRNEKEKDPYPDTLKALEEYARQGWLTGTLLIPLREAYDETLRTLLPGGWMGKRAVYTAERKHTNEGTVWYITYAAADATALKTLMSSIAHTLRGIDAAESVLIRGEKSMEKSEDL